VQLLPLPLPLLQGFDIAKKALLEFLDSFKTPVDPSDREVSSSSSQTRNKWQQRCAAPAHAINGATRCTASLAAGTAAAGTATA
jgi:hypothetical protein